MIQNVRKRLFPVKIEKPLFNENRLNKGFDVSILSEIDFLAFGYIIKIPLNPLRIGSSGTLYMLNEIDFLAVLRGAPTD